MMFLVLENDYGAGIARQNAAKAKAEGNEEEAVKQN
mgnify:CR=1 FL=1